MSVLDRAKAHFDSQETTRIVVPEWKDDDGNPTVIFSAPFTLTERQKLSKAANEDAMEYVARLVILKAMNEDGTKAFDLSDKPALMNKVDPQVLIRIAAEMQAAPTIEDMAGN